MARKHVLGWASLFIAVVAVSAFSQTAAQPQAGELSMRDAVQVMRRLNTAQAAVRARSGQYGTLAALLQHDPNLGSQLSGMTDTTASLTGYTLTLALVDGGRGYQAALTPARVCGPALFTNESGVIYRGWVLDCPMQ